MSFSGLSRLGVRLGGICSIALSFAAACGVATPSPDGNASGGSDGAGVGGTPGGSGAVAGTGATSAGGQDAPGGGSPSTGGEDTSGGGGDGGLGGASNGTGGTVNSEHLVDLGADCTTPGTFACSAANEHLAMICEADGTWGARETCEIDERCDFRDAPDPGLCRVVLPACETGSTEPFCGETGLEVCNPGGFDTQVLEECGEGSACTLDGCTFVPDECLEETVSGCAYDCYVDTQTCTSGECGEWGVDPLSLSQGGNDSAVVRLSGDFTCVNWRSGCREDIFVYVPVVAWSFAEKDYWVRVTMGPGWEMYPYYLDDSDESNVCRAPSQGCLILEPAVELDEVVFPETTRAVIFQPLIEPPLAKIARNVTFEIVPEGTTCD
jgi:hypothetical protein